MVELLSLAHHRACEAELAELLAADIAADRFPDIVALHARFAPTQQICPKWWSS